MKIFVSSETFEGSLIKFKDPMERVGMCKVDESLKLGQILIKNDDGKKYLVEMTPEGKQTAKEIN